MQQTEEYKTYMKSPEWQQKAEERKRIDNYRCVMCGRPQTPNYTLSVHHVTYDRLGHENVYTDLCTVCYACHQKIHAYYGRRRKAT